MPGDTPFLLLQIRPEDAVAESEYRAFLRYGELDDAEVRRVRVEQTGLSEVDPGRHSAILVGGSPFDFSAPAERKSVLQRRVEQDLLSLMARVVARDRPFLGACSGAGLLGTFSGTPVSGRYAEPVGGVDVTLTEAGRSDPLLAGLPATFRALVGHKEACDRVPSGAVLLAASASCPVQMFRVGANVYATQFHPEADPEGFALRIRVYRHHGYFAPETADALEAAVAGEQTPVPQQILARFVRRYRPT